MDYKVLYRKYRPQDFDSVIGQELTTSLLKNAIVENKISHAYIFTGPRGTGKTSTARIFAKAINCIHPTDGNPCNECDFCKNFHGNPDLIEIDAASNNGVDEMRELINNIRIAPVSAKYKVYIIDEFHMLSTSAFNALLLTLEEPPSNVVFILATTDIQNVPITVLSRCQRFDFKLISNEKIIKRLNFVCSQEKIDITDDAISEIAYLSSGGMRDALSLLDQISSIDKKITEEDVTNMFGSVSTKKIEQIVSFLEKNDAQSIINYIDKIKNDGINYNVFSNKLLKFLKKLLVDMKSDKYKGNLLFDNIYNLILNINEFNFNKSDNNAYDFLEICFLKYINIDNNAHPIINNNDSLVKNDRNLNFSEKVINDKEESNDVNRSTNICLISIETRINNSFATANKKALLLYKEKWNDFISYEANANKKLLSFIMDTNIVVASDKYAIITNSLSSSVNLINENIESLEKDIKLFYNLNCKFVAISNEKWQKLKIKYINNIKSGYKYSIIDEELSTNSDFASTKNDNVKLEKLANEIFGNDVEIK